jgi:rhodanese-related sulfurtransferase
MKKIIVLLLAVVAFGFNLKSQTAQTNVITHLSTNGFNEKMTGDKDAIIIDLRTDNEIEKGYIPRSVQIDYLGKNFDTQIASLDKNKTYYLYCQAGGRSADAAAYMEKQGFKKIYTLEKGFADWKAKGLPIDKK